MKDRIELIGILREAVELHLGRSVAPDEEHTKVAARKLQADALLTEAIQHCRQLTAEFPDNSDY